MYCHGEQTTRHGDGIGQTGKICTPGSLRFQEPEQIRIEAFVDKARSGRVRALTDQQLKSHLLGERGGGIEPPL